MKIKQYFPWFETYYEELSHIVELQPTLTMKFARFILREKIRSVKLGGYLVRNRGVRVEKGEDI